jgi:DNA helicase-2/ATP-dependent DNA helicase PcrA
MTNSPDSVALDSLPEYLRGLNERQREAALATEGPLIVLAGAGSGKTKMVTSRIAYLIDRLAVPAYNILAVTFTNKAAAEMRERVQRALSESAPGFIGTPEIGTFHAVCVRILRREIEKTPFTKPFVIYDDSDQLSLVKSVLNRLNIDEKSFNPKAMQAAINKAKCDALEPQDIEPVAHNIFDRQFKRVY